MLSEKRQGDAFNQASEIGFCQLRLLDPSMGIGLLDYKEAVVLTLLELEKLGLFVLDLDAIQFAIGNMQGASVHTRSILPEFLEGSLGGVENSF